MCPAAQRCRGTLWSDRLVTRYRTRMAEHQIPVGGKLQLVAQNNLLLKLLPERVLRLCKDFCTALANNQVNYTFL